jgi:predicted transcriptional regulator
MGNIATSVRITAAANTLLSTLAGKTGKSKAQIVEEALRDWEDRIFWTEVQQSFAASPESDGLRAERELWDSTVSDGLPAAPRQAARHQAALHRK